MCGQSIFNLLENAIANELKRVFVIWPSKKLPYKGNLRHFWAEILRLSEVNILTRINKISEHFFTGYKYLARSEFKN